MQTRILSIVIIVVISFISTGCSRQVSFKDDVKPILLANCLACHVGGGEGSVKSGFSVQSYDSVMKGTKYGPVIEPGESVASSLYRMIDHKVDPKIQMPPHHDEALANNKIDPLTAEEIETIKLWIDQGAKNN